MKSIVYLMAIISLGSLVACAADRGPVRRSVAQCAEQDCKDVVGAEGELCEKDCQEDPGAREQYVGEPIPEPWVITPAMQDRK